MNTIKYVNELTVPDENSDAAIAYKKRTITGTNCTSINASLAGQKGKWVQEYPTNAFGEITFFNEDEGSIKPAK